MTLSKADLESAALEGTPVTVRLPRKQSALLRLAVKDAMLLEKDPRYKLDMMTWHRPSLNGTCNVCLAGAVMACDLKAPLNAWLGASSFEDRRLTAALELIENMRRGNFYGVRSKAARALIHDFFDLALRRAPWGVYLKAADLLEEVGL
jgi:hypothetical protein